MSNKTSDKNVAEDRVIAHKFAVMQQQLEQKEKRIQELEEELEKATRQLDLDYVEENFIPKQVIKDKIEKIIRETTPTPVFKPKSMWDDTDYERLYKTQPLLELLEGEK